MPLFLRNHIGTSFSFDHLNFICSNQILSRRSDFSPLNQRKSHQNDINGFSQSKSLVTCKLHCFIVQRIISDPSMERCKVYPRNLFHLHVSAHGTAYTTVFVSRSVCGMCESYFNHFTYEPLCYFMNNESNFGFYFHFFLSFLIPWFVSRLVQRECLIDFFSSS